MESILNPLIQGYLASSGLIIAIGAQNAFVIRQGLMKNQVFVTALYCSLVDAILIILGVAGLGPIITSHVFLMYAAAWGGAAFLFWYGYKAFRAALRSESLKVDKGNYAEAPSLKKTLMLLSVFTLLNPHVYLDAVILLGSISAQFCPPERPYFAVGAIAASFVWFFGISYGTRFLIPIFENPKAWKVLDFIIGCVMWAIAVSLLLNVDKMCTV